MSSNKSRSLKYSKNIAFKVTELEHAELQGFISRSGLTHRDFFLAAARGVVIDATRADAIAACREALLQMGFASTKVALIGELAQQSGYGDHVSQIESILNTFADTAAITVERLRVEQKQPAPKRIKRVTSPEPR